MITVSSISGGRTSAYMAVKFPTDLNIFAVVCIDCPEHQTDPAIVRYAQQKFQKYCPDYPDFQCTAEDDQTLVAMMELEQFLGKEIIWVRGRLFDEILQTPSFFGGTPTRLPSWARRYCTSELKMLPIFNYLYWNGFTPCRMNIGFRADEPNRAIKMYFNRDLTPKNPHHFFYPVSCRTYGERKKSWKHIYWRRVHLPLKRNGVIKTVIDDFWKGIIDFPEISNCEGCFHKDIDVIAYKCKTSPAKMRWWKRQELIGKGTWRDDNVTYDQIDKSGIGWQLQLEHVAGCDSEGCTA